MAITEIGEYQGKPVIIIKMKPDDQYPLSLGVMKAKKVLAAIDALKDFVAKHDKPYTPSAGRGQQAREEAQPRRGEDRQPEPEQPRASEERAAGTEIDLDGVRPDYAQDRAGVLPREAGGRGGYGDEGAS